jgi:hypothetical protein
MRKQVLSLFATIFVLCSMSANADQIPTGMVHLLCHAKGTMKTSTDGKQTFEEQQMSSTLWIDYDHKTLRGLGYDHPVAWKFENVEDMLAALTDVVNGSQQFAVSVNRLDGQVSTVWLSTNSTETTDIAWTCEPAPRPKF